MKSANRYLIGTFFLVVGGFAMLGLELPNTALSSADASQLFGEQTKDRIAYDAWCVNIEACDDDNCQGGEFSCASHFWLARQQESQFPNTASCGASPPNLDCMCLAPRLGILVRF